MINSEFFNIELIFEYLQKYREDKEIIKTLITKFKSYSLEQQQHYLTEIVFFTLLYKIKEIDILLLDMCAEDFNNYILITSALEIWGF